MSSEVHPDDIHDSYHDDERKSVEVLGSVDDQADYDVYEPIDDTAAEDDIMLAPDHPLLAPVQKRLKSQLDDQISQADLTIRELLSLKARLTEQHETVGVELYTFQQQLTQTQTKIDSYQHEYQESLAARQSAQQQSSVFSSTLQQRQDIYKGSVAADSDVRTELSNVSKQVIAMLQENEKLRSRASALRRAAYRTEEEVQQLETDKLKQDDSIAAMDEELRRLEDEASFLQAQLDGQKGETSQARAILVEAYKQMSVIGKEKGKLTTQWENSLKGLEYRNMELGKAKQSLSEAKALLLTTTAEVKGADEQIEDLDTQTAQLSEHERRYKAQAAAADRKLSRMAEERDRVTAQYSAAEAALENSTRLLAELDINIKSKDKDRSTVTHLLEEAQTKLRSIEEEVMVAATDAKSHGRQALWLKSEIKKMRDQERQVTHEITRARNEISRRGLDTVSCQSSIDTLSVAQTAVREEIEEQDRLVRSYIQQQKKNADAIEQRASEISRLNRRLETHLRSHPDEDTGPLEATLHNLGKEITRVGEEIKNQQSDWLHDQTELVSLTRNLASGKSELEEREFQRVVLARKVKDLEEKIEKVEKKTRRIGSSSERLHQDLQRLNEAIASSSTKETDLHSLNYVLEAEVVAELRDLRIATEKLEEQAVKLRQSRAGALDETLATEEQIMLVQRRIKLDTEMREALDPERGQAELKGMAKEIHRMELRLGQIRRLQRETVERLELGVSRRESLTMRGRARMAGRRTRTAAAEHTGISIAREINVLRAKESDVRKQISDLERRVETGAENRRNKEREISILSEVCGRLREKISNLGGIIDGEQIPSASTPPSARSEDFQ